MRCKNIPYAVLCHVFFLGFLFLAIRILRWLIPSYAADHLLFSNSLSADALNQKRLNHAQSVINNSFLVKVQPRSDIEIRVVAADRKRGYLTQVIGYLLDIHQRDNPYITVCNVEDKIFPELEQFQGKMEIHQLTGGHLERGLLTTAIKKETRDYWECLSKSSSARYVMLLEDDALLIPEFPSLMASLIHQLDHRRSIDYVKLYHPNYLRKLPSIPITIVSAISLVCLFHGFLYGRLHPLFLPVTIVLYVIIRSFSYQLIADFRYFLTGSAYISVPESCCTPAVVFRSSVKNRMVAELSHEESYVGRAKDHILDESRFVGRQSDMNWVLHIGSYSFVRDKEVELAEKNSIWEQNRAKGWLKYFL